MARRCGTSGTVTSPFGRAALALALGGVVMTTSGCFTRRLAERAGISGWFRADAVESEHYRSRFEAFALNDTALACPSLREGSEKPVVVLVHGIGGEGPEMEQSVPLLASWAPPALFMFRWVAWDDRDEVAERLAAGLSHLAECARDRRIVVIAHSAGGVVVSHAASRVHLAQGQGLDVLTVASPLAGTVRRAGNADGSAEATLMLDLGSRIVGYPQAAPFVHVVHLRTQAPADPIMTPNGDLVPNDPAIGVPGAPHLDLPGDLDHSAALVFVVKRLIDGDATRWLSAPLM